MKSDFASRVAGGPLSLKEYNDRIQACSSSTTLKLPKSNYQIKYAYVSLRGYYPESLNKANQDAFCVHTAYGGNPEDNLFGVFDGHGEFGTPCSQFSKDKVPENLLKHPQFKTNINAAYHQAFVDSNKQLHRRDDIDDSLSGTTGITVLIRGKTLHVANVGDSRAVCAEMQGGKLTAVDLSWDQTPYRQDECDRVKKCGARILTLDQLEGLKDPNIQCWDQEDDDDGDPPRLWADNGMYPGTAFTRSIGDLAAEQIGVNAEPEIRVKELTSKNPFVVVASDGVFEFLSSQAVCDMVARFDDPLEAAKTIVAESYRLWLQYETRTDDITMVIAYISGISDEPAKAALPPSVGPAGQNKKPTRRGVSSKGRRSSIESTFSSFGADEEFVAADNIIPKTEKELESLRTATATNFLFSRLVDEQRKLIYNLMEKRAVEAGEVIIRQGDPGEHYFVIETGEYDVYVQSGDNPPKYEFTYSSDNKQTHMGFGELALMYGGKRTATVQARTAGVVWQLERRAFKSVLMAKRKDKDRPALLKTLRSVEGLNLLTVGQLQRLTDLLTEVEFKDGTTILRQGDTGDEFYVIDSGEVVCTVRKDPTNTREEPKEIVRMGANQYFGERALLHASKRTANVIAKGKVRCLRIDRKGFEEVMGPLQEIIDADRQWKEQSARQKEAVLRHPSVKDMLKFNMSDLTPKYTLYTTDCTHVALMKHKTKGYLYTVRQTSVSKASELGRQGQVMRAREISRSMAPSVYVPSVLRSYKDNRVLAELVYTHALCTMDAIVHEPLSEASAKYYAASAVLAMEHLHMAGVIYRGLSLDTLVLNRDFELQVLDFRFAKKMEEGRTYTLCGDPAYMAPEMVEGSGHNEAVDWWALGVMIFAMLAGEMPFETGNDDEMKIYAKILGQDYTCPSHFSPAAKDLIKQLLQANPDKRLGYGAGSVDAIKKHPWFSASPGAIDWKVLADTPRSLATPEVKSRLNGYESPEYIPLDANEYSGDVTWFMSF